MTQRELVWACEDVTRDDVERALAAGHDDMESLKRYTGLATGFCQGRCCLPRAAALLWERTRSAPRPTTARTPLVPTALAALAAAGELPPIYPGPRDEVLSPPPSAPTPPPQLRAVPEHAEVVIIGGGVM